MSRTHHFTVSGKADVQMLCAVCEKREWVFVIFEGDEDPCLAAYAAETSDWRYTHDDYVCSEECETKFWELA